MATRTDYEGRLRTLANKVENGDVAAEDAEAIRELCFAFDPEDARESLPRDIYEKRRTSHNEVGTLDAWCCRLTDAAQHVTLTDTTAEEINEHTTKMIKGDDGPGPSHVQNIEYALSKFYRFHDDLGVDADDIVTHDYDTGNSWDARDLLNAEERTALRAVADHPRDNAILHIAIYCGLRNTALRTLRVRDVRPDDHEWYFNTEADGLKNITRPNDPRPLFQAERAVREWVNAHPNPRPDNYLITTKPEYSSADPTDPVSRETIRRTIQNLKDRTSERDDVVTVEKPCHPHMMRHNFVSMCRRHPDITDADIKFYIGHGPRSSVMETTYSHLSSDDHNQRGHDAFGTADAGVDGGNGPPWDTTCDTCGTVLAPGENVCDACGADRGPTPWDDAAASDEGDITDSLPDSVQTAVRKEVREALAPGVPGSDSDGTVSEEYMAEVRERLGLDTDD